MRKFNSVLLVDDDEIVNFLNKRTLKDSGLVENIEVTTNGFEAIKYLRGQKSAAEYPEIILLDIKMPVMDGFTFLKEFYSLEVARMANSRIIVLSTSTNPSDMDRMKDFGIDLFVEKPLTPKGLAKLVAVL